MDRENEASEDFETVKGRSGDREDRSRTQSKGLRERYWIGGGFACVCMYVCILSVYTCMVQVVACGLHAGWDWFVSFSPTMCDS